MLIAEKTNIYHAIELSLRKISYVLYARALILRALMTQNRVVRLKRIPEGRQYPISMQNNQIENLHFISGQNVPFGAANTLISEIASIT